VVRDRTHDLAIIGSYTLTTRLPSHTNVKISVCRVSEKETENKMTLQNLAMVFGPTLLHPSEKQTGKLSMEELLSAGAHDAMIQIGILRYLLELQLRGAFGARL